MSFHNCCFNYYQSIKCFNVKTWIFTFVLIIVSHTLFGQNNNDTTLTLVGDTIYTNKNFKIFVGQSIIAGKGSLKNDWYKTMQFKNALNFPTMFSAMVNPKRETDDDTLEVTKDNNLLRNNIHPEEILTVQLIVRRGNKRHGYGYVLFLRHTTKTFGDSNIACSDIVSALTTKELILP